MHQDLSDGKTEILIDCLLCIKYEMTTKCTQCVIFQGSWLWYWWLPDNCKI